jgi:uncharacterized OB-fold protein
MVRLVEVCVNCGGELHWVRVPLMRTDMEEEEHVTFRQCEKCGRYKVSDGLRGTFEVRGPRSHRPGGR